MTTIYVLRPGCFITDSNGENVELDVGEVDVSKKDADYMISRKYAELPSKKVNKKVNTDEDKELKKLKADLADSAAENEKLKADLAEALKPKSDTKDK